MIFLIPKLAFSGPVATCDSNYLPTIVNSAALTTAATDTTTIVTTAYLDPIVSKPATG